MTDILTNRRTLLIAASAAVVSGLSVPARAQGLAPTPSMRGGANNYLRGRRSWTGSAVVASG